MTNNEFFNALIRNSEIDIRQSHLKKDFSFFICIPYIRWERMLLSFLGPSALCALGLSFINA